MPRKRNKPTARSHTLKPGDIEAGARFSGRRSAPRYPFIATAVIVEPITRTELSAQTSEISLAGCYVDEVDELPRASVVQICIHRDKANFETWGRVVYVQPGIGTGIKFFETPHEQRRTLEAWIAEISAFLDKEHRD